MRRFFTLIPYLLPVFLFSAYAASAQYGNEWIDFSKTYWKFRVGKEGICKITKADLDAAGIPASANGSEFLVFRDGKEVPLYVTATGAFSSGDYIAFYAQPNTGLLDEPLYLQASKHVNPNASLFDDTAAYFLTIDNSSLHKRLTPISTVIPPVPPAPLAYCYVTVSDNRRQEFWNGKTNAPIDYSSTLVTPLYSSQFDQAEGYVVQSFLSTVTANIPVATPDFYSDASLIAKVKSAVIAQARDSVHKLTVAFNGTDRFAANYGVTDAAQVSFDVPANSLSTSNTLTFTHTETGLSDNYGYGYWSVTYPHTWNFNAKNFAHLNIPASGTNQYIEVIGFDHGGVAPLLFDITNGKSYTGDISVSGKTRFYTDASLMEAECVLWSQSSTALFSPVYAGQRNFTDYSQASNQGDYIIIAHNNLRKTYGGKDQLQEYTRYRNSTAGGGHAVVAADIEELYDQFAWGVFTHPSAIVHFADYALKNWTTRPENILLLGKGVIYPTFQSFRNTPSVSSLFESIVPTFGSPGSDVAFVMDRSNWHMKMNIGRLCVRNAGELATYLNKLTAYEAALAPAGFPTPATEFWKKQVLQIAGGDGLGATGLQSTVLLPCLYTCAEIIKRPMAGATVTTIAKNTKGLPTTAEDKVVDSLITGGLSLITYYGHGSSTSMDYNIKDPSNFNSAPKIPVFTAFGCDISSIFRSNTDRTITEVYIAAPSSGSIAAFASNNQGYTNIHSAYIPVMYTKMGSDNYAQSIGTQIHATHDSFMNTVPYVAGTTSFALTHMESLILQGDPAARIANASFKPDFYLGAEYISTNPAAITTAMDSFQINLSAYNIGEVTSDTVLIKVEHTDASGTTTVNRIIQLNMRTAIEKMSFWIAIDKTRDLGVNKYRFTIDYDGRFDEISEANNTASIDVLILSDAVVPVYPYNFSILHKDALTLKASTLNPFKKLTRYRIEIDTTELFNSPQKRFTTIDSKGGVIKWTPGVTLIDSVVYYWRSSIDSSANNGIFSWSNSSFIYLKNGSDGWNQSHYFQYKYNNYDSMVYRPDRTFSYPSSTIQIRSKNTVMELPPPYNTYSTSDNNRVYWQGVDIQRNDCYNAGTIQILVFDSTAGRPWDNYTGKQGSVPPCFGTVNHQAFNFPINTAASRDNARRFLDSIPNGNYILVRNNIKYIVWGGYYVDTWMNDTLTYGSGNSLYHALRKLGFDQIDSFNRLRVFSMICQKGVSSFPVQQDFAEGINDILDKYYTFNITYTTGRMNSVVVGPASKWNTLLWDAYALVDTTAATDTSNVRISGINAAGAETQLYEGPDHTKDLSFIDASVYPKIKLQWSSTDTFYHTAPQLKYWRVLHAPVPEAALNPAIYYTNTDSINVGEQVQFGTAIENLTEIPMDSMLVRYRVIDRNGVSRLLGDVRYRDMKTEADTIQLRYSFDPKSFPGANYLFVEANPSDDQPEQYHPNNLGYIPFYTKVDEYNPLMDVTFDGYHILDRDIVSSKPFIKVLLRDENKYLALNDTSTMKLFVRYPSDAPGVRRRIPYDGSVCKFVPADMSTSKNEAHIEYRPSYTEDGIYQLYASGSDASGNEAGQGNDYSISFEVVNKSTITQLLNYPNPFSTSTAFVFTLTGSEIPTQFKIQILTVTGKVVREITRQEIGPIHIGRNITEYKWDGRDQYGQLLGNGVYLYRFVTNINGQDLERRSSGADKFFKNGYAKMYLMR
ncbi:MAG: C25 family cysteine peptidase [Chitinophagaceae bacterium]